MDSSLLNGMNPEQAQVVSHASAPLLVAAGAGCGKTRVLTHRVARFVEQGADPTRVLAVTFSAKTAREMNERLMKLGCDGARVGTFHSLALQILREEWHDFRSWNIDDSDRYRICVKDAVSFRYMDWKSADVTHLVSYIGRCKAFGADPGDAKALEIATTMYRKRPTAGREPNLCRQAYETAEVVRRERHMLTFDDMLVEAWKLLSSDEAARVRWASRWDHVLQDECQDENRVQHEIASMLARDHRSYTIVGDPAQCHPAGTMIQQSTEGRVTTCVPIESLRDGDEVRGWNQNTQKMVNGRKVRVAQRPFFGRLITVTVGRDEGFERCVRVTPNHRFVARWTDRSTADCVTYLMYREGFGFRVGWCKLFARNGEGSIGFHLAQRARIEKADSAWILRVHPSRTEASVHESVVAARYGLPTATFEPVNNAEHQTAEHQTAEAIAQIFEAVSPENVIRGRKCLRDHDLDPQLPLYPWPGHGRDQPQGRRTIFQVHAANLLPQLMSVPLPDRVGAWEEVKNIEFESEMRSQVVYSLQVEGDETYAACEPIGSKGGGAGIVVHNSIYNFRGANPQAMLRFEQDWGAQVVRMGRNYRSANCIVELANRSLEAMPANTHLGVKMLAERGVEGQVKAVVYEDFDAEGEGVTEAILESYEDGRKWSEHVVLFRTNAQSRGVEESLLGARIPYIVIGGTNFYDRREVKDLLAYLRVGEGRGTFDDVRRSINTPFRYLGKAFIEGLEGELGARQVEGGSGALVEAVRVFIVGPARLQQRQRTSALEWCELVSEISRAIVAGDGAPQNSTERMNAMPARILENLVTDLRYAEWLTRDEGMESPENNRVSNVRELIRAAARFPTVGELLDYVDDTLERAARAKREATNSDVVTLCSIHRSKGLEWPVVFVLGVNDKILPHAMAEDPDEERRLFYVACTRARDVLQLSCVAKAAVSNRVLDLAPSRFLTEVGIDVVPILSPPAANDAAKESA